MGFDQYHEPASDLSQETRTFARIIASLTEECEAIGWYQQRISIEQDAKARSIMENAQEDPQSIYVSRYVQAKGTRQRFQSACGMHRPKGIRQVLRHFEEAFSERVWDWAKVLLIEAILAPGERTVTAMLRVMGLQHERQFQNYHRVFKRAKWSSRSLSCLLLQVLIQIFVPVDAPIVAGFGPALFHRPGSF